MDSKNISIIKRILRYCGDVSQMVERFGDSFETFKNDSAYKHACSMCIVQIGELSSHLTDEFKQVHNGVPWKSIKAMRNLFAHNYEGVSMEKTWNTIKEDIPALSSYCLKIIEEA
jgi:uncharacterized protein with HEPN domain